MIAAAPPSPAHGSWLHRLSPIPKLAWLLAVVVFAFASYNPWPLLAVAVAGLLVAASARVGRDVVRTLAVLAPLAASIIVLQAIVPSVCADRCTTLAAVGPVTVHAEGIAHGLSLLARILAMQVVAVAMVSTTSPSDLLAALTRLRVPRTLGFMIALTLQLVPVLEREVRLVLAAQRARGMSGTGFRAVLPAFVPVFVGAVERMERLAISLESRGFGAAGSRTSYRRVRFGRADTILAAIGVAVGVAGTFAGLAWWGADSAPLLALPPWAALAVFAGSVAAFVGTVGAGIVALARA